MAFSRLQTHIFKMDLVTGTVVFTKTKDPAVHHQVFTLMTISLTPPSFHLTVHLPMSLAQLRSSGLT